MFSVPFLLAEAFNVSMRHPTLLRVSTRASLGLLLSVVVFPPLLLALRCFSGPTTLHLYSIPAAEGLSVLVGNAPLLLFPLKAEVISDA